MDSLFDAGPASPTAVTDQAVKRVGNHVDPAWMDKAMEALSMCASRREFTADDVWSLLNLWRVPEPREPRAMGAAMRQAKALGLIRPTGRYRQSQRIERHTGPMMIWEGCR